MSRPARSSRQFRSHAVRRKQVLESAAQNSPVRPDRDPTTRGQYAPWLWQIGKKT